MHEIIAGNEKNGGNNFSFVSVRLGNNSHLIQWPINMVMVRKSMAVVSL